MLCWWHRYHDRAGQNSKNKTSTQCREILRPFLHPPYPQILEKQKVCGTSVQITVPSECSLLLTASTYYGRLRGRQRSRKVLCALWGTLQGTMEKFLNIGKCFLKIKISIGMRARFQSSSIARNISNLTASCQCQFCQRATLVQWYTVSSAA